MPRKNTNARQRRSTSTLQAVPNPDTAPGRRTAAEDKLWAALHAHPAITTTELADYAGIGRSTAGKILCTWERDGSATRTPGPAHGKRRAADTWTITDQHDPNNVDDVTTTPRPTPDQPIPTDSDNASRVSEPAVPESATDTTAPPAAQDEAPTQKVTRLAKGALRGLVEDYLNEHAGEQFSPNEIGTALARSSGAVANALDRLVTDGYAIQTQDKPKRYATKTAAS